MTEKSALPKISIVTPSLNQGAFIEQTICSVLDQGYPNLEYIIIDGGSTDNAVEIIRQYAKYLAYWCSEPDKGQSNAINKGLQRATGDIVAYLNSDDQLLLGCLEYVAETMRHTQHTWMAGGCTYSSSDGLQPVTWLPKQPYNGRKQFLNVVGPWGVPQPACFWRRELFERYGYFREDLTYVFDTEFQNRLVLYGRYPFLVQRILANAIIHPESKTGSSTGAFWREDRKLLVLLGDRLSDKQRMVGQTFLWLVERASPQSTKQPRPSLSEYIQSLCYAPVPIMRASAGALLRYTGLKKWRPRR
jgi:glycosyltransferase involved in cell wall biosynthesis